MERIGIYGGTYSPPHIGHLRAAEYAIEALKLDRLLLIPTGVSPHKEMSSEEKHKVSHRGNALKVFYEMLKEKGYADK